MEHYKSDIEDQEYQIKIYQRFNLKPNRENVGLVSKSRRLSKNSIRGKACVSLIKVTKKFVCNTIVRRYAVSNAKGAGDDIASVVDIPLAQYTQGDGNWR